MAWRWPTKVVDVQFWVPLEFRYHPELVSSVKQAPNRDTVLQTFLDDLNDLVIVV